MSMPRHLKVICQCHQMSFSIKWWRGTAVTASAGVQHGRNWGAPGRLEAPALFGGRVALGMHVSYPECDKHQQHSCNNLRKLLPKFLSLFFPIVLPDPQSVKSSWSVSTSVCCRSESIIEMQYHIWKPRNQNSHEVLDNLSSIRKTELQLLKSVFSLMGDICLPVCSHLHTDDQALVA